MSTSLSCQLPGTHRYCTDDDCECWHHSDPDWEEKIRKPGGQTDLRGSKERSGKRRPGTSRWNRRKNK